MAKLARCAAAQRHAAACLRPAPNENRSRAHLRNGRRMHRDARGEGEVRGGCQRGRTRPLNMSDVRDTARPMADGQ